MRFPPQHADICQALAFLVKRHQKVAHIPDAWNLQNYSCFNIVEKTNQKKIYLRFDIKLKH